MASTITLQELVDQIRSFPEVKPFTEVGGYGTFPALPIANDVMERILAKPMNWKWNRRNVPTFLTATLQQDYVTNVTDMGWLEQGWRVDINNTAMPKPVPIMECVRDLPQTSWQNNPFQAAWIPNSLAIMGAWQANTAYFSGYGQASAPNTPIQQFVDANGNILFINSNSLGLSINSPGYSGTIIPTTPPYGTTGNSQPLLAANSAAGTTVVDGTVTWTVADPNGYAIRLSPIPAYSGLTWLINVQYQKAPPTLTTLAQTISPIPDSLAYLFRRGLLAKFYENSLEPSAIRKAPMALAQWEADLQTAVGSSDRERDECSLYPSEGLTGGGPWSWVTQVGPGWPYGQSIG